jgi:hypothetical protein
MIMNAAGGKKVVDEDKDKDKDQDQDQDENDSTKRKRAIYDVVTNTRSALVLFQEFHWKSCFRSHILSINTPRNIKFGSLKIIQCSCLKNSTVFLSFIN